MNGGEDARFPRNDKSLAEVDRNVQRVERDLRYHIGEGHVSKDAFEAVASQVKEIRLGQQWLTRLIVGQLVTVVVLVAVYFITKAVG